MKKKKDVFQMKKDFIKILSKYVRNISKNRKVR